MTVVLDSWAVLRYLEDSGRAAGAVARLLRKERPLMSWIDLGEVMYIVRRAQGDEAASDTVRDLRAVLDVRLPDEDAVLDAARIKADHPMAYADAFGAALAISEDAALWTGAPELLVRGAPWRTRNPSLIASGRDTPAITSGEAGGDELVHAIRRGPGHRDR